MRRLSQAGEENGHAGKKRFKAGRNVVAGVIRRVTVTDIVKNDYLLLNSTCMVGNEAEIEKCVCCETPKPGSNVSKKEPSPVKSLGSIAPGGGFKFGVASTASASSNSTNSGFKFGSSTPSMPETQGFQFGSGNIGITTTGN